MMRFKSENMVLQHMNHYKKAVSEEENNAYIPDKYFNYQVNLNLVHFSSKSQKKKKKKKKKDERKNFHQTQFVDCRH